MADLPTVSSFAPLEKVDYYPRGDGLADIRIRENIRSEERRAEDGHTYTEYLAEEAYVVSPLTEQEAIEQADLLITAYKAERGI